MQQAVTGRPQLAGPGAASFEVPLEIEPLGEQVSEILLDDGLVDLVVAEASANEDDSGPARQRADGPEVQVASPHDVVAGKVVPGQHPGQDEGVCVGAVGRQEDQRMALVHLPQLAQAPLVGLDGPGSGMQRTHDSRPQVDRCPTLHRDQFR